MALPDSWSHSSLSQGTALSLEVGGLSGAPGGLTQAEEHGAALRMLTRAACGDAWLHHTL